ncbi:26932_t:CDS:2, partial [Racocetra persica]
VAVALFVLPLSDFVVRFVSGVACSSFHAVCLGASIIGEYHYQFYAVVIHIAFANTISSLLEMLLALILDVVGGLIMPFKVE